jgi:glycolate oxidase FAD binding subunit
LPGGLRHQQDDLTLVAPATARLRDIQDILSSAGQALPIDPPLAGAATLGGVLASGLSGPLRSRYGLPRDLVLGMSVMRADGVVVRAGGRVVKNVTGYDLMRMWCGSLGTLGIITEVAVRVYPAASTVAFSVAVESVAEGIAIVERLYRADFRPEVADILADERGVRLHLRLPEIAARAARSALGASANSGHGDTDYLAARDAGHRPEEALCLEVTSTLRRLPQVVDTLMRLHAKVLVVRPIVGVARAAWAAHRLPELAEFRAAVESFRDGRPPASSTARIERQPENWDGWTDPWGTPPSGLAIMRRLKEAYDPDGRLNRGRFAGGI